MNKKLRRKPVELYHYKDGEKIIGPHINLIGDYSLSTGDCTKLYGNFSGLSGNCTGLMGDCTGLYGDCTNLYGDLDECEITNQDRQERTFINDLVEELE